MKYSEIKNLQPEEIKKRLDQNRQALFSARIKHKMQRQANPLQIRFLKRDISRLETILAGLPPSAFKSIKRKPLIEKSSPAKEKPKSAVSKKIKTRSKAKTEKEDKKNITEKPQTQTKKKSSWFGLGGGIKAAKNFKFLGKKSFFRRKSG